MGAIGRRLRPRPSLSTPYATYWPTTPLARCCGAAQFHAQLRQLRDPVAGDNIGMALTELLHHAVESSDPLIILSILPSRLMVLPTPTKRPILLWESFLQRTARLDEMLATLAGKLNSNESFNPDRGFQVDVVFVSMPSPGSCRRKKYNPGRRCLDRENKKKQCIVTIKNREALCCARAIVTMRAHCHKDQGVDGFRDWDNLKRGLPVQ